LLKLRKILLCNYPYIILLVITILLSVLRLSVNKSSRYNLTSKHFTGIITKIIIKEEKISLYIKNSETVIATSNEIKKLSSLNLGDKIKITGLFSLSEDQQEEYLFNYQEYLKRKNIFYLVKIEELHLISKNKNIYYTLKQNIDNRTAKHPYLQAFILGDKSYLNNQVKRSFQENGISHLFAISGMHITLLSTIIEKLLSKRKSEEEVFKITTIVLLIYLQLVGYSPSVLRGVFFYIFFKLNKIYYFYINPLNIYLTILSITLLINPNYLFDVGAHYSFLISLALILLSNTLKSDNYFTGLLKVSLISFLVSIPISLYNFYQLNILSILYNLFFVPLISLIIFPLTIITFLLKSLLPILNLFLNILEKTSLFLAKISIGKLVFKRLPLIIYFIYLILIFLYVLKRKRIFIIILTSILLGHFLIPSFDFTTYLKVLNVGQGDSLLLHTSNKNILIDTGGTNSFSSNQDGKIFYNTISPTLKSLGIDKINTLLLTHGDKDHIGEAITLVNNFKVEKVIFNCGQYNYLEKKLIKVLNKKNIKYYNCIKILTVGKEKLYFLNTREYDNENDNSNVIYTELNNYKFLFMGDAGVEKEKDLLDEYNLQNIDVLKVGHHGSNTSSSKEFIKSINPKYSLISVGENNKFKHPNKEALTNLNNSKVYRTDKVGSITLKIKHNRLIIETSK